MLPPNNKFRSRAVLNSLSAMAFTLAIVPNISFAQEAQPQTQAPPQVQPQTTTSNTPEGQSVVVTGTKPNNRIDRQVYDPKNDIASQTGNAADALNRVPSVNVDSDGNVSLRGNSNVNVLINGRASAMMRGDNRAAAILSMSGSDIESIEVMNNPGAQFASEGSGGIINLVMRRNRRPGKFLSLSVNAGEEGRLNSNATGSYTKGNISINGGISYRNDGRAFKNTSTQIRKTAALGSVSRTEQIGVTEGTRTSTSANFGIDYTLNDHNTIGFQTNFARRDQEGQTNRHYLGYTSTNSLISDYLYNSLGTGPRDDYGFALNWDHKGDTPNETLKADLRYSNSQGDSYSQNYYDFTLPSVLSSQENRQNTTDSTNWVASIDYNKPVGDDIITAGAQVTIDDNQFNNVATAIDNLGYATIIPNQTNAFEYYQKVSALYFTYQKPIGEKWIAQAGIRFENTDLNTFNPTSNVASSTIYNNWNPSAFVSYDLADNKKIRLSYSHRLQRPNPQDLNPTITYQDAENISVGNPDLRPQETDSFEIGYEVTNGATNYQIRGFYKLEDNVLTSYSQYLTNNIIQTSRINGGNAQSGGVEFNLSTRLFEKLNVGLNSTLSYIEQDKVGGIGTVSGTSLAGRLNLDYALTTKDKIQFMIGTRGKQFTPQGYTTPMAMSNLAFSHQINPAVTFVANITDPFGMGKFKTVTDSDTLYSSSIRSIEPRTFYVGFRILLGTRPSNMQNQQIMGPTPPPGHGGMGRPPIGGFGGPM